MVIVTVSEREWEEVTFVCVCVRARARVCEHVFLVLFLCNGLCASMEKWDIKDYIIIIGL